MHDSITVETFSTMSDIQDSITVGTPRAGEELEGGDSSFSEGTDEGELAEGVDGFEEAEESEDEGMVDD